MSPAGPKGSSAALEGWLAAAERRVLLPTGTWMKVIIPSVRKLRRKGAFPDDLLPTVNKFENEGITLSELADDELEKFVAMMAFLVADMVRSILVPTGEGSDDRPIGEWQAVTLTGADMLESSIDEEDKSALQAIAIRKLTPNQVTIASRRDRALAQVREMTPEEQREMIRKLEAERQLNDAADAAIESETGETIDGWRDFRDDAGSSDNGPSRGEVRDTAEPASRHP